MEVCLKVLEAYCRSWEYSLSAQHLPHFKQPLAGVDARVLLEYASRLWGYLEANPAWGRHTGFEALLMIKRASLAGCVVPERYTHVLIDESQDIPAPLLQIIERGRQVLITLGDEYQQASGLVDPASMVRLGKQTGAQYMLYGNLASIVKSNGKVKDVFYQLTMNLMDLRSGELVWADQQEIRKQSKKKTLGW
mgnify:CR=1 FL=1